MPAASRPDGLNRRIRKITYGTDGTTVLSDVRYIHDGSWHIIEGAGPRRFRPAGGPLRLRHAVH